MVSKKTVEESVIGGESQIDVNLQFGYGTFHLLGLSPMILESIWSKTRPLMIPPIRKGKSERENSPKHNPFNEFRESAYTVGDGPTYLAQSSACFKKCAAQAAVDLPGVDRKSSERQLYIESDYTPIYGVPYIFSTVTRCADIKRTPDVRTRCLVDQWAATIIMRWIEPMMNETKVAKLVAAGGILSGIGGWRAEKGGRFGSYEVVDADDPRFVKAMAEGGRDIQLKLMANPVPWDAATSELLEYFRQVCTERGWTKEVVA